MLQVIFMPEYGRDNLKNRKRSLKANRIYKNIDRTKASNPIPIRVISVSGVVLPRMLSTITAILRARAIALRIVFVNDDLIDSSLLANNVLISGI